MKPESNFRHESLQDKESVVRLIKALTSGLSKGKLTLEDEDGKMVMQPEGLMNLKITASQNDQRSRVVLRLTWHPDREVEQNKNLKIRS